MSNNTIKLAYAYGSLRAKTAETAQEELTRLELEKARREAARAKEEAKPGYMSRMGKRLKADEHYRQNMLDRAAMGVGGLAVGSGAGALGANAAIQRMRQAGLSEQEIASHISTGGGAARGAAKTMLGGGLGAGLGYGAGMLYNHFQDKDEDKIKGLEEQLSGLGGLVGGLGGAYSGYSDEMDRANEAIAQSEMQKIMQAASKGKKYRSTLM